MKNTFFHFSASILPYITIFFLAIYVVFFNRNRLALILISVIIVWLSAFSLKIIFHKLRPQNRRASALFSAESKFSFPSEHSAIFASLAVSISTIDFQIGIILCLIAILIGSSRAVIKVHFWTDIIVGWGLGVIITTLITTYF